jgi:pimeloyl-ACP methyl ester carboxylesterase
MVFSGPEIRDLLREPLTAAQERWRLHQAYHRLLDVVPRGDGRPVLVLPGFLESDGITQRLRRFLNDLGYAAYGWNNGVNRGLNRDVHDHLLWRVDELYSHHQCRVAVIGHSLGGFYARLLGHRRTYKLVMIITTGTPFAAAGDLNAIAWHARTLYKAINIREVEFDIPAIQDIVAEKPPIPATSIYARNDGVVDWRGCLHTDGDAWCENVEVTAAHFAMLFNPETYCVIGDRLAQAPDNWRRFNATDYPEFEFPDA